MPSPSKVNLNDVSIASPCRLSWDEMDGDELARFCSACKLNVYNVSEMTRSEAESFLRNQTEGQVCLRLYRRQDGTLITKDCPLGRKISDGIKNRLRALSIAIFTALNTVPVLAQSMKSAEGGWSFAPRHWRGPSSPALGAQPFVAVLGRPTTGELKKQSQFKGGLITIGPVLQTELSNPKLDSAAHEAFVSAQKCVALRKIPEAYDSFETALNVFRDRRVGHDPQFVKMVASQYALLLRKQKNATKAKQIENEFCL